MYKIGDAVVYKKDVCKIVDIKRSHLNNEDYYIMIPLDDPSLKIDVPASNRCGYIRDIISKNEVLKLIKEIPRIKTIDSQDKLLEQEYKRLMTTYNHRDLISIIKTSYLRNKEKEKNKKKLSDKDNYYFNQAEKYLYNEFSVALNMSFEETKNFVIQEVMKYDNTK